MIRAQPAWSAPPAIGVVKLRDEAEVGKRHGAAGHFRTRIEKLEGNRQLSVAVFLTFYETVSGQSELARALIVSGHGESALVERDAGESEADFQERIDAAAERLKLREEIWRSKAVGTAQAPRIRPCVTAYGHENGSRPEQRSTSWCERPESSNACFSVARVRVDSLSTPARQGFADGSARLRVFARLQTPLRAKNACSTGAIK